MLIGWTGGSNPPAPFHQPKGNTPKYYGQPPVTMTDREPAPAIFRKRGRTVLP